MNKMWNKGRLAVSALSLGMITVFPSRAWADNPIVQTSYTADPAPMVHEGVLYLYTSHDEDVTVDNFYTMNDWHLYSTKDMVNWTDHGSPAGLHTFSWGNDSAWAPQGIFRDGHYFLYVPLNNNSGSKIGVGVSDNVAGPFMDPLGKQLAASGDGNIDPTVFIDDDGQAYLYWGHTTLRYVKLNEDMISYSGSPTTVNMSNYTEGPWFYKRESLYYLVYASIVGGGSEMLSYATSNSPTGPWTARGNIMPSGKTFTNHAGVVDYKGHSYFFYHNSALPGGGDFKRSVCVEEFSYGADGSIPALTMSTEGPEAVATLNPFAQVEAETIANSSGLKTEKSDDTGGGLHVMRINAGDYIKVKNVDFLDGVTSFEARVSASKSDATIELHLDSKTGTLLGSCDVSGASSWTTTTCEVSGGSGTHDLFLTFGGGGDDLFKFNWWTFSGPTMPGDGSGGSDGAGGSDDAGGSGGGSASSGGQPGGVGGGIAITGGNPGTGGDASLASGGSVGVGGSVASGGATPTDPNATPGPDSGSCACRMSASQRSSGSSAALWLAASSFLLLGRRRRDRSRLRHFPRS